MEVKIYREPENEALILDEEQLAEYHQLTSELGLKVVEHDKQEVPNVYTFLNSAMTKQLHAICPQHVSVEDYKKSTIPVEVLKVLKWTKLFADVNRTIDVHFLKECGKRKGSWKGGTLGCGYTLLPNEQPIDCLKRMEKERDL